MAITDGPPSIGRPGPAAGNVADDDGDLREFLRVASAVPVGMALAEAADLGRRASTGDFRARAISRTTNIGTLISAIRPSRTMRMAVVVLVGRLQCCKAAPLVYRGAEEKCYRVAIA
jgi:hypothetical protein